MNLSSKKSSRRKERRRSRGRNRSEKTLLRELRGAKSKPIPM